jgi:hypothetical protein
LKWKIPKSNSNHALNLDFKPRQPPLNMHLMSFNFQEEKSNSNSNLSCRHSLHQKLIQFSMDSR